MNHSVAKMKIDPADPMKQFLDGKEYPALSKKNPTDTTPPINTSFEHFQHTPD